MAATITEIAKRAKVSTATVSRVFSGNDYVKEETRERILALAGEMGYSPRPSVRQPVEFGKSGKVGLVIPDIRNAYYTEIIHGIEAFLRPDGISPLVCSTDEDPEKEFAYLRVLQALPAAGIILVPTLRVSENTVRLLSELEHSGIPVVLLDRDIRAANMDGVFMDNYSGAYQSTQALIACGHRHIAFLSGPEASSGSAERLHGYCDALHDGDIRLYNEYIIYGDFRFDLAYDATKALLHAHPEITAIFSSSRRMSSGCIFALTELGLSVGRDIALICCGRLDIGAETISHVSYPTADIGRECGKILYGKMASGSKNDATRRRTFFDMKLNLLGSEVYPRSRRINEEAQSDGTNP